MSETNFLTWFIKKVESLKAKKDENGNLNTKSYQFVGHEIDRLPDSYPAHSSGGYKKKSIIGREKILLNELSDDLKTLITDRVISESLTMPKKSDVLSSNNYTSLGGTMINPIKKSSDKFERGHLTADALGGSRELDNFVPEAKKSNRKRGARNIEKVAG